MGSQIRKNSPTIAKDIAGQQAQVKVNASDELVVSVSNIGNGKTAFQNPLSEGAIAPVLATASLQDSPNGNFATDRGILIMANNIDNGSFRQLISSFNDALTTIERITPGQLNVSSAQSITPSGSVTGAIAQFKADAGITTPTHIVSLNTNQVNSLFTLFETVIVWTQFV